jgi:carbon-monoxide dehydrogenase medium subunit
LERGTPPLKPAPFAYVRAEALAHVHELLTEHGSAARLLAGGQSLMPALNMRLAAPSVLIDINALEDQAHIAVDANCIRIGALVRHAQLERSRLVSEALPLLSQAIMHVAHPAIRNRGTFGGSLALGDPAAELPACCLALEATMIAAGPEVERRIPAAEFFVDLYETALMPGEVLLGAEFAPRAADEHCAFVEIARRHGDYATVGVTLAARVAGGVATELRLVFFAIDRIPKLAASAASCLTRCTIDATALARAKDALRHDLDPLPDVYHGAQTKLHLAAVVLERALARLPLQRA